MLHLFIYSLVFVGVYARIGVVFPFFWLYLQDKGLEVHQITMFFLMGGITSIASQQVWGYLADVISTRRRVLTLLFACSGIFFSLFFLFPDGAGGLSTYHTFLLIALLDGLVNPPISQISNGLIFGHPRFSRRFPIFRAIGSVAFIVTNLSMGFALKYEWVNYQFIWYAFLFFSALGVLSTLLTPCQQNGNHLELNAEKSEQLSFGAAQLLLLKNPYIMWALALALIYHIPFAMGFYSLMPFLIENHIGASTEVQSMTISLGAIVEIPMFLVGDLLIRKLGVMRCLFLACVGSIARLTGTYYATEGWHIIALASLHSVTFGLFYFAMVRYIDLHTEDRLKASSQTLFGIVYFGCTRIISNTIVTYLLRELNFDERECYLFTIALSILALVVFYIFWAWEKREKSALEIAEEAGYPTADRPA
jgi:PPP family 3-phenylpropionic acid transporter